MSGRGQTSWIDKLTCSSSKAQSSCHPKVSTDAEDYCSIQTWLTFVVKYAACIGWSATMGQ